MEDVPYYCPACDLKIKKDKRPKLKKTKGKPAKISAPKPRAKTKSSPKKAETSSGTQAKQGADGIKLKISLKSSAGKAPKPKAADTRQSLEGMSRTPNPSVNETLIIHACHVYFNIDMLMSFLFESFFDEKFSRPISGFFLIREKASGRVKTSFNSTILFCNADLVFISYTYFLYMKMLHVFRFELDRSDDIRRIRCLNRNAFNHR